MLCGLSKKANKIKFEFPDWIYQEVKDMSNEEALEWLEKKMEEARDRIFDNIVEENV